MMTPRQQIIDDLVSSLKHEYRRLYKRWDSGKTLDENKPTYKKELDDFLSQVKDREFIARKIDDRIRWYENQANRSKHPKHKKHCEAIVRYYVKLSTIGLERLIVKIQFRVLPPKSFRGLS